jgi:hypothetical protein
MKMPHGLYRSNIVNFKRRLRSEGKFGRSWPARYTAGLYEAQTDV